MPIRTWSPATRFRRRSNCKKFHLPPGFEIQLVAAEPDIHKPINLTFDHRGRLWVTQSVEYPYPGRRTRSRPATP